MVLLIIKKIPEIYLSREPLTGRNITLPNYIKILTNEFEDNKQLQKYHIP